MTGPSGTMATINTTTPRTEHLTGYIQWLKGQQRQDAALLKLSKHHPRTQQQHQTTTATTTSVPPPVTHTKEGGVQTHSNHTHSFLA